MKKALVVALVALFCQPFIMSMQPDEQISPEKIKKLSGDIKGVVASYKKATALGCEYTDLINKILSSMKPITLLGHTDTITQVAISADSSYIVTGSYDDTAKIWGIDGKLRHTIIGHASWVNAIAISPDTSYIVTGSRDNIAKIWGRDGILKHTLKGHTDDINSVVISPGSSYIVTGSDDKTAKIWGRDGTIKHTLSGHTDKIKSVAINPTGKYIVTGSADSTAKMWGSDGMLKHTLVGSNNITGARINSIAINGYIVTGSSDHTAKIWGVKTLMGHTDEISSVAISPNNNYVVTGSESWDSTAKIWDRDGNLKHTLSDHTKGIASVAISPDNSYIVTGSKDTTAKIWIADGGTLKHTLNGHTNEITSVAISLDGSYIVTGSSDGTAKIWPQLGILKKLEAIAYLERFPGDKNGWPELRVAFMRKLIEATKENGNFTTKLFGYFGYSKKLMLDPALQKDGKPGTLYMIFKTVFDKDMQAALAPFIQIKQPIPGGFYSNKID